MITRLASTCARASLLLLLASGPAWADCLDTASNDCDEDGFATTEGDCDDDDPEIFPGADDGCDGIDNDCNDEVDEDCDEPLRDATLGGGSTCDSVGGAPVWLGLLPLLAVGRRRA